jgi:hypothetical protein
MLFDDTYTHVDTCDQDAELDFSHHTVIEEIQPPYQKITFDQDPEPLTLFWLVNSTSDVRLIDRSINSIDYYDVPLVCSRCMVLGSNEIDFIQTELTYHNVETVHQPSIEPDTDFAS